MTHEETQYIQIEIDNESEIMYQVRFFGFFLMLNKHIHTQREKTLYFFLIVNLLE